MKKEQSILRELLNLRDTLLEREIQNDRFIKSLQPLQEDLMYGFIKNKKPTNIDIVEVFTNQCKDQADFRILVIEKKIEQLISQTQIWKEFGEGVKGFGFLTCAYLIAYLKDPYRFKNEDRLKSYCGLTESSKKVVGKKVNFCPTLKKVLRRTFPEAFHKNTGRFPNEPYSVHFFSILEKEKEKAESTSLSEVAARHNVSLDSVKNLGYKHCGDKKDFLGFLVVKKNNEEVHYLNPAHVIQRARVRFSTFFIGIFWQEWKRILSKQN